MKKLNFYPFAALLLAIFIVSSFAAKAQSISKGMTNERMDQLIKKEATEVEGEKGYWQMIYGERFLLVITDENNNRMRIFTPVIAESELKVGQLEKMLEANFHSALDAKYSLYENYVISVFTHPLKELVDSQFIDAMHQVVALADTFGTTYSSTDLIYGGGNSEDEKEKRLNQKPSKNNR